MSHAAARAAEFAAEAEQQSGLLTRAQLRALGADSDYVHTNVDAGRWQTWGKRVVATQTGPLSGEQIIWFAVLEGGPNCVLSGLSALHAQGLRGFPVERVQTAVPRGERPERSDLFIRRTSRRVAPEYVHPTRTPPMLRVPAALIDALESMTLPRRCCALLAATVQQRLLRPADVRTLIEAVPTLPNRGLYLRVASDIEGGAQSLNEIDFRKIARKAGLPAPVGQAVRVDRLGRRRYLDADFDGFGVEVDVAVHLRPLSWWEDTWRLNEIALGGKPTLRFPSVGIYLQEELVIDQLQRAARRWS